MRTTRLFPLLPLLATALAACGEGVVEQELHLHQDYRLPPPGMESNDRSQALGGRQVVYLNFEGVTIRYGRSDATQNTSWIVEGTTTIPAFAGYGSDRAASIRRVVDMVRADFVEYDLEIVTERPTAGAYTMVAIGGKPQLIGESSGVAGIAPLDAGNGNPSDIVFAFSEVVWSDRLIANVISHEFGHSFGLDHLRPLEAIMYPTVHDRRKTWMNDVTYDDGVRQNEPEILAGLFGLKTAEPPAEEPAPASLVATFVGQDVPASVRAGETFEGTIRFRNDGTATWTAAADVKLGSESPRDNDTWGGSRVELGTQESIAPGQTKEWYVMFQAPSTPGVYTFQWQMLEEGRGRFGAPSAPLSVEVFVDAPAPEPEPAPAQDAEGRLELVDKTWGYGYAFDPDQPDAALEVQIYLDGRYAGSLDASQPRAELVEDGTLPSPDHGFAFWMPRLSRGRHTIEAWAVDTDGTPQKLVGSFTLRY